MAEQLRNLYQHYRPPHFYFRAKHDAVTLLISLVVMITRDTLTTVLSYETAA